MIFAKRVNAHPTERRFQFILSNDMIAIFEAVTKSLDNRKRDKK